MLLAAVSEARSAEFAANPAESDERLARRFHEVVPTIGGRPSLGAPALHPARRGLPTPVPPR